MLDFVQAVDKAKEIIANLEGESFVVEVLEVESNSKVGGGIYSSSPQCSHVMCVVVVAMDTVNTVTWVLYSNHNVQGFLSCK